MLSLRAEFFRRAARWVVPVSLLALAPKCVLCVLAYAGAAGALGLGVPELCGATAQPSAAWTTALAWLGVAGGLGTFGLIVSGRCGRPAAPKQN